MVKDQFHTYKGQIWVVKDQVKVVEMLIACDTCLLDDGKYG